ncbi:DNA cytosine methyltransferase [Shouchella clausii]|uniref:DNA cytosine methyltransferase n=1 Tax=Shouchella clausii TaxID=79880 RepID=UPI00289F32F3|nr:DNA (cytosine-5-)-methyltransferase [Shouchella clausii]
MKSIELFAGIGGIALAAEWAGIETVAFCERDPYCQKVLNKHWPDVPIFDDIRKLNKKVLEERGIDVGAIELVTGGFPCQPYSVAGLQRGTEDDRDLWPEMFRIIREIRPTWVVGENVANFANMELDRTLSNLESIGYKGRAFILPACAVEAPHERSRTFVVAYAESERRRKTGNDCERYEEWPSGCRIIPDADSKRFSTRGCKEQTRRKVISGYDHSNTSCKRCNEMEQHDGGGTKSEGTVHKIRERRERPRRGKSWWETEPNVGRVAYGVSDRVDRLKGLGNAVVPQQIYPIFRAIVSQTN